ncbi:MAG: restriction endonuclease [Arcobacter sp.]|nr:MAG: restriction endonuclease [Arcobacter sp.]
MKLAKKIAILAIIGATSLFAAGVSDINVLVDKINSTTDIEEKTLLMKKLNSELDTINKKDLPEALEIVNVKLKKMKKS